MAPSGSAGASSRRGLAGRDLGTDQLRALEPLGQRAVAGHTAQRAPVEVADVEGGGRAGGRLRLGHEPLGDPRHCGLFEQGEGIGCHGERYPRAGADVLLGCRRRKRASSESSASVGIVL